jgi:hypothetical protein
MLAALRSCPTPHPCGHIVYPYSDEGLVGQAVCLFASAGLRDGDGVILIMSSDHCESINLRLQLEGIQTETYERLGRLICLTAEDLLAKFICGGVLDEGVFKSTIDGLIDRVRRRIGDRLDAKVRVFGEMVSELRNRDLTATTRLEELWNEAIKEHSIALWCTYALNHATDYVPKALLDLHSANIERELSVARASDLQAVVGAQPL